ncbi:MAG: phosphoribosylanthranilate isomerase [Candidatus Omnitrophica bacterium]|nr:phosphoribosylanthranilate isomerase [Candidatus Omnitrophota bacterium]
MIKIKICGITNLEDALFCSSNGADALGFIFAVKSPRCLKPRQAKKIIEKLDPFITKIGVFMDQEPEKVLELARYLKLDGLQFHGNESPNYCRNFSEEFKVIKVLFPENSPFEVKVNKYKNLTFLFDIPYKDKKDKGLFFSREILDEINYLISKKVRVILSGGINSTNISKLKKNKPYAFDVCSSIETIVGKKDKAAVKQLIGAIKK